MKEKFFYIANCAEKAKILFYNILFAAIESCGKILALVSYHFKPLKPRKK